MNRIARPGTRSRIRPRTTVIGGAVIGLIAGAAAFGAVSSSSATASSPIPRPALARAAVVPAAPAPCAKGQKLDRGVCVIHVVRTVVVPAGSGPSASAKSQRTTARNSTAVTAREGAEREQAEDAAEQAEDAAEQAEDAAQASVPSTDELD